MDGTTTDSVETGAHILVVDDDERIAASIRRALSYEGYDVSVAHDGQTALSEATNRDPDLLILDVMMPGFDGIDVCRRLRARGNDLPILMLTARAEVPDRVQGLDAGADDYLAKPFAYEELLARVRSLLRRHQPDDRVWLSFLDLRMDVDAMEVLRGERRVDLTALEFRLLEHLLRHPRVVLTRTQLREAVWADDGDAASNVVDVYVRYLRQKLEAGGEARVIHTMRGTGYVLRQP